MLSLSSKLLFHILENGQTYGSMFLLIDYAFWSIFKTTKILNYMEVIAGDHLSTLFLSPVNSIVAVYGLYLWKKQWRNSALFVLSGNLAALNTPGGIIITFKDRSRSFHVQVAKALPYWPLCISPNTKSSWGFTSTSLLPVM